MGLIDEPLRPCGLPTYVQTAKGQPAMKGRLL
jgi:hypothetical protein